MVYCSVHILKLLHGVCFEKRLCSFEAKGQEFVTFSRHCCCSREITIIWMHFIMLCIFRALFTWSQIFQGNKTEKILPGTEQQKASRLGPTWWPLSFQQDTRTTNLAHPAALFCPAFVLYKAFITQKVDYSELERGSKFYIDADGYKMSFSTIIAINDKYFWI